MESKSANASRVNLFSCARMILRNECPPDRRAYLCMHGEEPEDGCINCWDNYLFFVANGCKGHPYEYDLRQQKKQDERGV